MDKYLPILIVGAIIGIFTIAFLIAYIRMKHDKNYKEYERNMSDSQLIKRLLSYGRPYLGQFILVFIIMLITMMIPAQVTIVPRFVLFKSMDLYNNLWALILPAWFNVTSIFLLRTFYMSLPDDLMEAAKIDGANHFQIWARIMMPLTMPAMVTAAVLAFINSWNEYLSAIVFLPTAENYTVSQGIQYWLAMSDEHNLMMTAAASAIVPVVVLFLFTQRYFVESIATTGVKG